MLETERCNASGKHNCLFNQYKIGEADSSGRRIEQIVYLEPNKYIIYFVEKEYLKPYYIDAHDFLAPFTERFQQTLSEIKEMNVKNDPQNEFMRQEIASAYYDALNGYDEVAVGALKTLKEKLLYRAYAWWFTTYAVLCGLMVIASVTMHFITTNVELHQLVYCITSSCIGGLLIHSRKQSETGLAAFLPSIAAYISFFSSIVSGFLIYCVLESNLLLGEFSENSYKMILVCFVAGYSEDFPLKIIDKISEIIGGGKIKKESK